MPYTYLIGWRSMDVWYYGVRYAKGCSPDDLWKTYFTSSKRVAEFRAANGEPDVIEVRKTFDSPGDARRWEERVLDRVGAVHSPLWLNRQNHGKDFNNDHLIGKPLPREVVEKRAAAQRGAKRSPESKAKMSAARSGMKMSPESCERNRVAQTGKKLSEEHKAAIRDGLDRRDPAYRAKISVANKGRPKSDEHRKAISAGHQNRSPEYREKLRQAAMKRWAHKYDVTKTSS